MTWLTFLAMIGGWLLAGALFAWAFGAMVKEMDRE